MIRTLTALILAHTLFPWNWNSWEHTGYLSQNSSSYYLVFSKTTWLLFSRIFYRLWSVFSKGRLPRYHKITSATYSNVTSSMWTGKQKIIIRVFRDLTKIGLWFLWTSQCKDRRFFHSKHNGPLSAFLSLSLILYFHAPMGAKPVRIWPRAVTRQT